MRPWLWRKNKTAFASATIGFVSGIVLLFTYFFPSDPSGALIYSGYFASGYFLNVWLGLPGIGYISFHLRTLYYWLRRKRRVHRGA